MLVATLCFDALYIRVPHARYFSLRKGGDHPPRAMRAFMHSNQVSRVTNIFG
jgi:hypothetical protein